MLGERATMDVRAFFKRKPLHTKARVAGKVGCTRGEPRHYLDYSIYEEDLSLEHKLVEQEFIDGQRTDIYATWEDVGLMCEIGEVSISWVTCGRQGWVVRHQPPPTLGPDDPEWDPTDNESEGRYYYIGPGIGRL